MLKIIKAYHRTHRHYPNISELSRLTNKDRRQVAKELRQLERDGIIKRVKAVQIVTGDYQLIK